jgi:hypothetical protein
LALRFLPFDYPLAIAQTVHLSSPLDTSAQPFAGDWELYTCFAFAAETHGHSLATCSERSPMPAFRHRSVREPFQQVNTLAMLLAAHQRLSHQRLSHQRLSQWERQASRLPISADVLATCTLLEDMAEDVSFVPDPEPGSVGAMMVQQDEKQTKCC